MYSETACLLIGRVLQLGISTQSRRRPRCGIKKTCHINELVRLRIVALIKLKTSLLCFLFFRISYYLVQYTQFLQSANGIGTLVPFKHHLRKRQGMHSDPVPHLLPLLRMQATTITFNPPSTVQVTDGRVSPLPHTLLCSYPFCSTSTPALDHICLLRRWQFPALRTFRLLLCRRMSPLRGPDRQIAKLSRMVQLSGLRCLYI
jgi:hypothetical protein